MSQNTINSSCILPWQSYLKTDTARVGIALLVLGSLFMVEIIWYINNGKNLSATLSGLILIQMVITSLGLGPFCGVVFGGKSLEEIEKQNEIIPQINPESFDYSKLGANI